MVPALLGREQAKQHEYLYWDYGHSRGGFSQAVRMGDWKGIRTGLRAPVQLYDLADDPGETRDLAKQRPEVVSRIERCMDEAYVPSPEYPVRD